MCSIFDLLGESAAVERDLPTNRVASEGNSSYKNQKQERTHGDADDSVDLEVTVDVLGRENQGQQATHDEQPFVEEDHPPLYPILVHFASDNYDSGDSGCNHKDVQLKCGMIAHKHYHDCVDGPA